MIRKLIAAALLASTASVGAAQTSATPAPAPAAPMTAAAAATDPARLAAARRFIDAALPDTLIQQALVAGMRSAAEQQRGNTEAARRDPHHAERARLELRVVEEETARILRDVEPGLRGLFADFYARSLTAAELEEGTAFYASPAGRRFGEGALNVVIDPEYEKSMKALDPLFAAVMTGVERRYLAATAGLPPIPGLPTPPAAAASAPPAAVATPAIALPPRPGAPADPARMAAARRALDALWPSELFRRELNLLPAIETLIAIRAGDFGVPIPPGIGVNPNATLAEIGSGFDPHLRQRLPVLTRFAGSEMARLTTAMEPGWKLLTADAYAREFTVAELDEVTRFFSSAAGRRFAVESYRMFEDPQLIRGIVMMLPRVAMQFPAMNQRVAQATAHLPPVPAEPAPAPPGSERRRNRPRN
ncbi:MAG TPA: DUF2059 domain-containing protein [Allosphingosinicella sp.]|nr:DUF2059 domain-containing protein [Allosphingosinicella sp.]